MNTLSKAIILSLSSALVAAPVMAAPQDHHSQQHTAQHQTKDSIKALNIVLKKQNALRTTGSKVTKYQSNTTATALK